MKVNAKLGGTTSKIFTGPTGMFKAKTLIIGMCTASCIFRFLLLTVPKGADVSHPSPASPQASMAAITMSFDLDCCRYAAGVQTNGYRVEMITRSNIDSLFTPMLKQWVKLVNNGQPPQQVFYFRDGVSEGQYTHVLEKEVAFMKEAMQAAHAQQAPFVSCSLCVIDKLSNLRTDQVDCRCLHQASPHPLLPHI